MYSRMSMSTFRKYITASISSLFPLAIYKPFTSQLCHFSPEDGKSMSQKLRHRHTKLHGAKPRNYTIIITTAVKTSNLTSHFFVGYTFLAMKCLIRQQRILGQEDDGSSRNLTPGMLQWKHSHNPHQPFLQQTQTYAVTLQDFHITRERPFEALRWFVFTSDCWAAFEFGWFCWGWFSCNLPVTFITDDSLRRFN